MKSVRESVKSNKAIVGILGVYLVVGMIYSVVTPLFEASDEMRHYAFVKHLADGYSLPVQRPGVEQPWRQEGSQPPLYYALMALATCRINTEDMNQVLWPNPHADVGISKPDRNINMFIHTEREAFPYRGTTLAVHIIRWLSLLMGVVTVFCTYLISLDIFPERKALAVGAAAFVAFNPMFLFISGSVNNDNLATALSSFALWRLLRLVKGDSKLHHLLLLGLTLGLAALAKASALGLFALAALALIIAVYHRRSFVGLIWESVVIYGVAAAVSGWWFVRNWQLYGDALGLNTFAAISGPRYAKPTLRQLWGERGGFAMSFWGFFGGLNVPMSGWLYRLLDGLAALSLPGLAFFLWRERRHLRTEACYKLLLTAAWPAIVLASLVRWTLMTLASQGRLVFVAIGAIAFLLMLGWTHLFAGIKPVATELLERLSIGVLTMLFLAVAVAAPFVYIAPAYARPPILSEKEIPSDIERLDVTFGDQMQLIGYRFAPNVIRPGEAVSVTLYWRALAPMSENYSVFVHLLSENDLIVGQRDMYPGHGTYPTSLWRPGDIIADTYVVPVSPATLAPAKAQIEVGLYKFETWTRLMAVNREGVPIGDQARFGQVEISPRQAGDIPNPVYFNLDNKIALVGYALDRTAAWPGETIHLTLYWRALSKMQHNYSVFTHILGEKEQIWAQKDAWPQNGNAPTSTWRPGQIVEDRYELVVKDDAPAGVCDLEIGVYLGETGQRLNLLGKGGYVQDNRILLGKVRIVRP